MILVVVYHVYQLVNMCVSLYKNYDDNTSRYCLDFYQPFNIKKSLLNPWNR